MVKESIMANSGVIKSITGVVKAIAVDGTERVLHIGDTVVLNETIITDEAGAVSIWLSDGTKLGLTENASTILDDDFFTQDLAEPLLPADFSSVEDEVAAIQQALANDESFDPTTLEAPAAGGVATNAQGGEETDGHSIVDVEYLNPEMTPENGFDTTGISVSFLEPQEELLLRAILPPTPIETADSTSVELDESAGQNTTALGSLSINGVAPQTVSLSAPGAQWDDISQTLTANDGSYKIDVNNDGTYIVTLLTAMEHPAGEGVSNQVNFNISAELTSDAGNVLNTGFTVSVYDDGPIVNNTQGVINNNIDEALEGLIDYNLGLDGLGGPFGLGGVSLDLPTATFNGSAWDLSSKGDKLSFHVDDIDGDNVDELYAFVDVGQTGWDGIGGIDRDVFTLQALEDGKDDSAYKLVMHDVLDLPIPVIELSFDNIATVGQTNTSLVVFSDTAQTQSEMLIESVVGLNASNGFVGVGLDNEMNSSEWVSYRFGTVENGSITETKLVNDVQLHEVDVTNSGADAFQWTAFKGGVQVGTPSFVFYTAPDDTTGGLAPRIHVDGGYDTLVITAHTDFKVGGVKYCDCSDTQDIDVLFGYTATDNDLDKVSSDFTVVVSNDTATALDPNLSTLLTTPDSLDLTV